MNNTEVYAPVLMPTEKSWIAQWFDFFKKPDNQLPIQPRSLDKMIRKDIYNRICEKYDLQDPTRTAYLDRVTGVRTDIQMLDFISDHISEFVRKRVVDAMLLSQFRREIRTYCGYCVNEQLEYGNTSRQVVCVMNSNVKNLNISPDVKSVIICGHSDVKQLHFPSYYRAALSVIFIENSNVHEIQGEGRSVIEKAIIAKSNVGMMMFEGGLRVKDLHVHNESRVNAINISGTSYFERITLGTPDDHTPCVIQNFSIDQLAQIDKLQILYSATVPNLDIRHNAHVNMCEINAHGEVHSFHLYDGATITEALINSGTIRDFSFSNESSCERIRVEMEAQLYNVLLGDNTILNEIVSQTQSTIHSLAVDGDAEVRLINSRADLHSPGAQAEIKTIEVGSFGKVKEIYCSLGGNIGQIELKDQAIVDRIVAASSSKENGISSLVMRDDAMVCFLQEKNNGFVNQLKMEDNAVIESQNDLRVKNEQPQPKKGL